MNDLAPAARQALVLASLALVDWQAWRIWNKTGRRREFRDLWQDGALGLVKAAAIWDPLRGTQFKTLAERSIRWEIFNAFRKCAAPAVSLDGLDFPDCMDPRGEIERRDLKRRVGQRMRSLPWREQLALWMSAQGFRQDEIASVAGCSRSNVSLMKTAAVRKIRRALPLAA